MRIDLHNHTKLCNHATGTVHQYIEKAISLGIDVYGFSEHAPMKNFEDGYRLTLDNKPLYESEILSIKEEYKNKIDILLGYEVDYIKGDYMLDDIKSSNVDYLIGSVHYLNDWGFDNPEFIKEYEKRDIDKIWQDYFNAVEQMAKSNIFNIVGHLDLIKVFKFIPKKDIKLIALNALKAIKRANMVVELNSAGFRKPIGEQYPSSQLLELCYELDIPICFSSDAHSIDQVGFKYKETINIAKDIGYSKCSYFKNKEQIVTNF